MCRQRIGPRETKLNFGGFFVFVCFKMLPVFIAVLASRNLQKMGMEMNRALEKFPNTFQVNRTKRKEHRLILFVYFFFVANGSSICLRQRLGLLKEIHFLFSSIWTVELRNGTVS